MSEAPEISPTELNARWPNWTEQQDIVLLDIREPEELKLAMLEKAKHIPMAEIPTRVCELNQDQPLIVMCHSGARSRQVADFLASNGFAQVFNLAGGIDAWSREIDSDIPRY